MCAPVVVGLEVNVFSQPTTNKSIVRASCTGATVLPAKVAVVLAADAVFPPVDMALPLYLDVARL